MQLGSTGKVGAQNEDPGATCGPPKSLCHGARGHYTASQSPGVRSFVCVGFFQGCLRKEREEVSPRRSGLAQVYALEGGIRTLKLVEQDWKFSSKNSALRVKLAVQVVWTLSDSTESSRTLTFAHGTLQQPHP